MRFRISSVTVSFTFSHTSSVDSMVDHSFAFSFRKLLQFVQRASYVKHNSTLVRPVDVQ